MRANNLTICVPNEGCDKNCPYCISKMTGRTETNWDLMKKNMEKVKTLARASQITNVLLTGKGEPFLCKDIFALISKFKEFPVELQTNGIWVSKHLKALKMAAENGLNLLAISVDNILCLAAQDELIKEAKKNGLLVRITFNVTNRIKDVSPQYIMKECKKLGVDQLTFRKVSIPTAGLVDGSENVVEWIKKNVDLAFEDMFFNDLNRELIDNGRQIRILSFGSVVYDHDGLAVTWIDYCIQEFNKTDDIRSLIFQEDGHLYTSWNSKASKLF